MEELDYALVKVSCEALSAHFQRVRKHATRELAQVVAALNKPSTAADAQQQQQQGQQQAPPLPLSEEAAAGLRARLAALRKALLRADAQEKEILARCHRVRAWVFVFFTLDRLVGSIGVRAGADQRE